MSVSVARRLSYIGVCLALLIVCAQISIPIWIVPITLQTLAVGLIATVLPLQLSSAVIAAYLLLGLVGLPVFANFAGGASVIVGPTGGYLFGFIIYIGIVHYGLHYFGRSRRVMFSVNLLASLCQLLIGTLWLRISLHLGWQASFLTGFAPYVPIEILKSGLIVAVIARLPQRIQQFR